MLANSAQRGRGEDHYVKRDFILSLTQYMHVKISSMLGFVSRAGELRVVFLKIYFFHFKTNLETKFEIL